MRWIGLLVLTAAMAACSTVQTGTRKAERTLARIGDRVEEKAETAGRKTRGFFQRLFGGKEEKPRSSSTSIRSTSSSDETEFDTYTPQYVGTDGR